MHAPANLPRLTDRHALFLDFDGTLAPIQDDADTVRLPDGLADSLARLQDYLGGAIIIISGRDIRDLSSRVPGSLWRAGGHGLEICAPGEAPAPLVEDELVVVAPDRRDRDPAVLPRPERSEVRPGPGTALPFEVDHGGEADVLHGTIRRRLHAADPRDVGLLHILALAAEAAGDAEARDVLPRRRHRIRVLFPDRAVP